MKKFSFTLLITWFATYYSAADFIVVPGSLQQTEGNSATTAPFDTGSNSIRYQQVYAASEFSAINQGGGMIRQLTFRADGPSGRGFFTTLQNVQIDFSTTSKQPDSLSPVFSENIGTDNLTVFGPGPLFIYSGAISPVFDILVTLDRPFYYNPAAGNLLLDVRNFAGGTTSFFDAERLTGDSVSSMFSSSVGSPTGTLETRGLVTGFYIDAIPEPSSAALFGLGLALLWGFAHRSRRKTDSLNEPTQI